MEFLSQHGLEFEAKDVREDPAALAELVGLGFQSTPVLVIDGKPHAGFVPSKVKKLLDLA